LGSDQESYEFHDRKYQSGLSTKHQSAAEGTKYHSVVNTQPSIRDIPPDEFVSTTSASKFIQFIKEDSFHDD